MIQSGMVDAIISTGALMSHGLSEGIGLQHFKVPPALDDEAMYKKGYNRVYDTLELESNLNSVEAFVRSVLETLDPKDTLTSEKFCRVIGDALLTAGHRDSILGAAAERNIPVFIPAFTDCEVGLDVATWALRRARAGSSPQQRPPGQVARDGGDPGSRGSGSRAVGRPHGCNSADAGCSSCGGARDRRTAGHKSRHWGFTEV
jgi:hypothetical protein